MKNKVIFSDVFHSGYPEDFLNNVVCGDATSLIRKLPNESVDLIVTDPPYGLNTPGIRNDSDLSLFYHILPELYRVMKKDSWFVTFFSTKYLPKIFLNNPFEYYWQVILYMPEAFVRSPVGITKFMSVFIFKKGNPIMNGRMCDIIKDTPGKMVEPDEGFINHPTPKPKQFIGRLIEAFSKEGDLVLDPFTGSGSSLLACKLVGRRFIGFEIEPKYCELACSRLNSYRMPGIQILQQSL